jgi:transcriptional regulator with XRE-family HTH domain
MPRTVASDLTAALVGDEIRRARLATQLTQAEVADRLGLNASYVSNVEAGRGNLTLGQLTRFADAIGCDLTVGLTPIEIAATSVTVPSR